MRKTQLPKNKPQPNGATLPKAQAQKLRNTAVGPQSHSLTFCKCVTQSSMLRSSRNRWRAWTVLSIPVFPQMQLFSMDVLRAPSDGVLPKGRQQKSTRIITSAQIAG